MDTVVTVSGASRFKGIRVIRADGACEVIEAVDGRAVMGPEDRLFQVIWALTPNCPVPTITLGLREEA